MHGLGVRFALDDFGTGYCSLAYLQTFSFDRIKIDRSFIANLSSRPACLAIIRAVTQLAADLGMQTTAEGVETQEQATILIQHGVTDMQGYLFGRAESETAANARAAALEDESAALDALGLLPAPG
jgi:EAL domain-containing protein (putative c-di-GMP-specific phosphodiesterase class I)